MTALEVGRAATPRSVRITGCCRRSRSNARPADHQSSMVHAWGRIRAAMEVGSRFALLGNRVVFDFRQLTLTSGFGLRASCVDRRDPIPQVHREHREREFQFDQRDLGIPPKFSILIAIPMAGW